MEKEETTTSPEVKVETETTVNDEPTVAETEEKPAEETKPAEPTVAELHKEEPKTEPKKDDSIPRARLNKEIARRKELEKELAEAKEAAMDDDDYDEPEDSPEVQKLADRLSEIEKREADAKRDVVFKQHFDNALENMPEYKGVVNMDVIKGMALNPQNKDKTYRQLIEDAYSNALSGKQSIETTTPRGGAKDTVVDMKRAQTDTAYRHEVLADPELRKQYNKGIENRIQL